MREKDNMHFRVKVTRREIVDEGSTPSIDILYIPSFFLRT